MPPKKVKKKQGKSMNEEKRRIIKEKYLQALYALKARRKPKE